MKIPLLLLIFSWTFIPQWGYTQVRPSSTVGQSVSATCAGCQITNPDAAWDQDPLSYAALEVNLAAVGEQAEVTYQFTDPVSQNNRLSVSLQFSGGGILSGIASEEIFNRLEIQLLDIGGNIITTYDNSNAAQIDVISDTENKFEVRIFTPDPATQRIRIATGDLLTLGLSSRDLFVYDIMHIATEIYPVTTVEDTGFSGFFLSCIGCSVQNADHVTATFDANSEYADFSIPLSVSLSSDNYLFGRYSWGGTEYSGNNYDLYLILEDPNLLSVGAELLFFENNNISVAVTYGDDAEEVFQVGEGGLITPELLGTGSGQFYLRVDANDSKTIKKAEVRFGGNLANIFSNLSLYSIFVAEPIEDPFGGDTAEAVYTVNPAKPVNDYSNTEVLATATDADGAITSAAVSAGSLPDGVVLENDGTIKVADASLLVAGTYNLTVTTTDENGGTTTNAIALTFNAADQEAVYTLNPAKPVNDYVNGEALATAADGNGNIVSAVVSLGSLPAGVALASDGTITVTDFNLLVAGSYIFRVTTTDEEGGITDQEITIVVNPTDIEAVYSVNPARPVNDYEDDDILATAADANGAITSATVSSGNLPAGVQLENDGSIKVADSSQLIAGTFSFAVTTTDENGGTTNTVVELLFGPFDQEAVYVLVPSRPKDQYTDAEVIATVTDANGAIIAATVISGSLPAGISLSDDGTITVDNAGLLAPGSTVVGIQTEDELGGFSESLIAIVIDNPGDTDVEAVYTLNPAKPVNDYADEEVVASANDTDGAITNAVVSAGSLPNGLRLDIDGTIVVDEISQLTSGNYGLVITTTDELGGTSTTSILLVFYPTDIEAVYALSEFKPVNDYVNTEVLATASDANGMILSAVVSSGSLPDGVQLDANGTLSVVNASLLVAATYNFMVTTTDEHSGTTVTAMELIFYPTDQEAVYTIFPAFPVNDYDVGDTLATVTDANGAIVEAQVTIGNLPTGVQLEGDGTIIVANASQLIAGTYSFPVTTTDENGGTTDHAIVLTFSAEDQEAIYEITTSRPVDEYHNSDTLATATDANGAIVMTTIISGSLPDGIALAADGTLTISDTTTLVEGEYIFTVETTDEQGGSSTVEITLTIGPADTEAIYTIKPAKPVNMYSTADTLAVASDTDGAITFSVVIGGSLPTGVALANDGTIRVSDASQLAAGTHNFSVVTTDEKGGVTNTAIVLVINLADQPAIYQVYDAKRISQFIPGDTLATVTDSDGSVVSATVTSGSLPPGVAIQTDGALTVSDTASLQPGSYSLSITTTDANGGTSENSITLRILANDQEAIYTLNPAKSQIAYELGEIIAYPTDGDGPIISAMISAGELPAGMTLQANGTIKVTSLDDLKATETVLSIITTDEEGGTTTSELLIRILISDTEAQYTIKNAKFRNTFFLGDSLATVTDPDGLIVDASLISGNLPKGTSLTTDGSIIVTDTAQLLMGSYLVTIVTKDQLNGTTEHQLLLTILPDAADPEVVAPPSKPSDDYQAGDTLVIIIDRDSVIVEIIVDVEELPPGTTVDDDGNVIVTEPDELNPGEYLIVFIYIDYWGNENQDEVVIVIDEPISVDPWPGFSPDGDGINDYWQITHIEDFPNNEVKIFNRWGEVVFTEKGYNNIDQRWDGEANNGNLIGSGRLPQSTYFYILYLNDGTKPLTGYITLKY